MVRKLTKKSEPKESKEITRLGQLIKYLRLRKGLSRQEVVRRCGGRISYPYLTSLEQGLASNPCIRILAALADALEVPGELFFASVFKVIEKELNT